MKERPFFLGPVATLVQRELQRFYRQRDRVIGAVAQPILFWILFGSGLRASFKPGNGGMSSLEYFLPGTVVLIVLFTAIFATISIIEDRNEGFLQAVLAAPVARSSVVLGKVLGATALAVPQGLVVLLLGAPVSGLPVAPLPMIAATGVLILISFGLTGVGLCIAWRMDSTQGFHAIMSVFLFPMWILSGAFFPAAGAPVVLRAIMACDPLTYGVAALRRVLYLASPGHAEALPSLPLSLALTTLFAIATFALAVKLAARPATGKKPI
ncbi:MAG: ABC transporter permease [Acidobacteriota bacterium]